MQWTQQEQSVAKGSWMQWAQLSVKWQPRRLRSLWGSGTLCACVQLWMGTLPQHRPSWPRLLKLMTPCRHANGSWLLPHMPAYIKIMMDLAGAQIIVLAFDHERDHCSVGPQGPGAACCMTLST